MSGGSRSSESSLEVVVDGVRSPWRSAEAEEVAVSCLLAAARELPARACWELSSLLVALVAERSADPVLSQRALCLAALQSVADHVGELPTVSRYEEARLVLAARGVVVPGSGVIVRLFGGWVNALRAAGFAPTDRHGRAVDQALYQPRVPRYNREDLLDALAACAAELGRAPTVKAYLAWRERRQRGAGGPHRRVHLPHDCSIRKAFGSWDGALVAAGIDPMSRKLPHRFSDLSSVGATPESTIPTGPR